MDKTSLIGKKFGRLTVLSFAEGYEKSHWNCVCECGTLVVAMRNMMVTGSKKSCGCLKKETNANNAKTRKVKHGWSRTKVYRARSDAIRRCYNKKSSEYIRYGARGIRVSEEFLSSPVAWCEYLGNPPDDRKWSVERIDTDGDYERGNLKWALPAEQVRNRRKNQNNTSGVTGVWKSTNGHGVVSWNGGVRGLNGEEIYKSFSINKYGDELAFLAACEFREQQIFLLNQQGAGYSDKHGL